MARIPKQQRSKVTVDTIIEAGFICVAELGLRGTTTRHIADKAGISVGSLYEYFENKDAVYEAMIKSLIEEIVFMIQPLIATLSRLDVVDAVRVLLEHFKELLMRNNERYLKCIKHMINMDIRENLEPIIKVLLELVMSQIMHHPELTQVRNIPAMSYIFINGGIFAVIRHLSDSNPPISFEELSIGLANMIGHYVAHERALVKAVLD